MRPGWVVSTAERQGSNPGGCKIFRTHPDRSRRPPSLLYKWYGSLSPGVKRRRRDVNHATLYRADFRKKVEIFLHPPSCAFLGYYRVYITFTYTFTFSFPTNNYISCSKPLSKYLPKCNLIQPV